jgi:hypothetical protein
MRIAPLEESKDVLAARYGYKGLMRNRCTNHARALSPRESRGHTAWNVVHRLFRFLFLALLEQNTVLLLLESKALKDEYRYWSVYRQEECSD